MLRTIEKLYNPAAGAPGHLPMLKAQIKQWLEEDIGTGDVTTLNTIPADHVSKGIIHAKEAGVAAGIPLAALVFHVVDETLTFKAQVSEGSDIAPGTILAEIQGNTRSILLGERLALNLMQRLSGVSTKTKAYVKAAKPHPVKVVDTRKTTPGHRLLEKYAVRVGGGSNHRFGLYDAVMIKDNHIKASGGINQAIKSARASIPHTMKIEVEIEQEQQLQEAIEAGADIIMLDNMSTEQMKAAVKRIKSQASHIIVEASGGVSLETINMIAACGVDVISVGDLTSSIKTLDISLDLNEKKGGMV
jgi:nicotinate-nucleotide pyrophosphorylase (carboxylating)